jgi:RNA polymerase sigma-70 factor (ECF subfamily)
MLSISPDESGAALPLTPIDEVYGKVRRGDTSAFAAWVGQVEHPLRASLRSFARHVDTEAIVQEALLRMWVLAPRRDLQGPNASLRYAITLAQNLARREATRGGRFTGTPPPEMAVAPDPPPDPALRRVILGCIERLPRRPRECLLARLTRGPGRPDKSLAEALGLRLNTFLQNVVRARALVARCLESHGLSLREILR